MMTHKYFRGPTGAMGLLSAVVVGAGNLAEAYEITDFGRGAYHSITASMDAILGITGYTIEDFEDSTLVDDLTLTNFGFLNFPEAGGSEVWDGGNLATFHTITDESPGAINFNVAGGASSVGIGLSSWHHPNLDPENPQRPNRLRINGGAWIDIDNTNFPNLDIVGNGRSGYLRIDQEPGDDPITIIELSDPGDETLKIDHLAFASGARPRVYTITDFAPAAYDADTAAMDAALGTTGYTIEDFEDETLEAGLTLTNFGTLVFPEGGASEAWDGSNAASFSDLTQASPGALNFAEGADLVGIGLSSFHNDTNSLRINGGPWITIDTTNFPNLAIGDGRNGYLRIDRPAGAAPITTIEFADPDDETLVIDHLAFGILASSPRVYTITDFGLDAYDPDTATMDETLGITGYTVEDFEDAELVADLTLTGFGTLNFPEAGASEAWDGSNLASFFAVTEASPGALNFNLAGGADSVGIGLSSVHFPNAADGPANLLRVNGGPWITIDRKNFPNLAIVGNGRSGYLRIDRPPGAAPITIVEFADPGDETLKMDHVAFTVATDPPRIIDLTLTDEPLKATISWTSIPGRAYAIDISDNLEDWIELDDGVSSGEPTISFVDDTLAPGTTRRYYRVREAQ